MLRRPCAFSGTIVLFAAAVTFACGRQDEVPRPVRWSAELAEPRAARPGDVVNVRVTARVAKPWYFYSITQAPGGPIRSSIWIPDTTIVRMVGGATGPPPAISHDPVFGMEVEKYVRDVEFVVPVVIVPGAPPGRHELLVNAQYQACNEEICLSPWTESLAVPIRVTR